MKIRIALALLAVASPLAAQQSRCENGAAPRADLAISLACQNCTIGELGQTAGWNFSSEPRVTAVHAGAPKGLRVGDEIVRVNGFPITSDAGAAAFGSPAIGKTMVLTVRRDGSLQTVTAVPAATCPEASRSGAVIGGTRSRTATTVQAGRPETTGGWLGIGFSCSNCGVMRSTEGQNEWRLSEPPTVYSVETTSPAYRAGLRRGDVITHINGVDVTRPEASRTLGEVKPGETLRVTYRRGTRSSTVNVRAAEAPARAATTYRRSTDPEAEARALYELAQRVRSDAGRLSSESERRSQEELLRELRAQAERQTRTLSELQSRLRRDPSEEQRRTAAERLASARESTREQQQLLNELLARQQEETHRMQELQQELQRASGRVPLMTADLAPTRAPTTAAAGSRRLSYSGSLGDTDIEVRGSSPVVVNRDGDVITIQVGDNTIKITQDRRR